MIKKINIDDLITFNNIGVQVNDNFLALFNLKDIINSGYENVFGYYIGNKLVGFIHISKLYENMDIINIVVDASYRRQGIGSKLLNFIISLFDDCKTILLEVNENNKDAIDLYKRNNFKVINIRTKYYGNDNALIMKRDV